MDRTNPHVAILIFVLIIIGGFGYAFIAYNRAQVGMNFTSPHEDVEVYLDGQLVGTTPVIIKKVPFGFKNFLFKKAGFQSKELTYDYKPQTGYTSEIFLSDNSLESIVLNTAAQQFATGAVFGNQLYTTIGLEGEIETFNYLNQSLWAISLKEMILKPILFDENLLVVGSYPGILSLIDRGTGKIIWQKNLESNVTPLAIYNEVIWVSTSGGKLYSISFKGEVLTKDIFQEKILEKSFSLINGVPAFVTVNGDFCQKNNGEWQITKLASKGFVREGIITPDQIYLTTSHGHLYAFQHTGEIVFLVENSYAVPSRLALNKNLVVSTQNQIFLLNPLSGQVLFQRHLPEEINGLFFTEDRLLVAGKNGFLYFFDLDGEFITTKDLKSEIFDVKVILENDLLSKRTSFLVTTRDSVRIINLPGD